MPNCAELMWKTLRQNPDRLEARNRKIRKLPYHDKAVMNEITNLYQNKIDTIEIARKFNVGKSTILRAMRICKIPRRSPPIRYTPNLEPTFELGYTIGVMYGDGCCTERKNGYNDFTIRLETIDLDFAKFFAFQFCKVIGRHKPLGVRIAQLTRTGKPYYRTECRSAKFAYFWRQLPFDKLALMVNISPFRIGFLRGFYDSEGCICMHKQYVGPRQVSKKHPLQLTICVYNTNVEILTLIKNSLLKEGITSYRIREMNMKNRWNVKPLYTLWIHQNLHNIVTFITKIGTRIKRKQKNIWQWKRDWIPTLEP